MALGIASYVSMSKNYREEGAISQVDVMLRTVRNSAMASQSPAYVEIDAENRRIVPWATRTIALWHFEDDDDFGHTSGSRHGATFRGATQSKNGKIGKCARIGPGGYVDAGDDPDFDLDDGGYLEAYIRPIDGDFTGENFMFSMEGSYSLKIGKAGVLVGTVAGNGDRHSVKVFSKTYKIVPGRWTKVAFAWDRNVTRVLADDLVLATGPGATPPITSNPFLIGHDSQSFDGLIDEVRVMACVSGGVLELPSSFTLTHTAAPWNAIYFAGDGSLDVRFHAGPIQITVEQEGRSRSVAINMFGNTTRLALEKTDKKQESDESADTKPTKKAVEK